MSVTSVAEKWVEEAAALTQPSRVVIFTPSASSACLSNFRSLAKRAANARAFSYSSVIESLIPADNRPPKPTYRNPYARAHVVLSRGLFSISTIR